MSLTVIWTTTFIERVQVCLRPSSSVLHYGSDVRGTSHPLNTFQELNLRPFSINTVSFWIDQRFLSFLIVHPSGFYFHSSHFWPYMNIIHVLKYLYYFDGRNDLSRILVSCLYRVGLYNLNRPLSVTEPSQRWVFLPHTESVQIKSDWTTSDFRMEVSVCIFESKDLSCHPRYFCVRVPLIVSWLS